MTVAPRQRVYIAASALAVAGGILFWLKREQTVALIMGAAPTVFTPDQYSLPATDFPPGTAVTYFQGQMTPRALPNLAAGASPSGQAYIPLFGFLPGFGFGLAAPDGFA